MDQFVNQNADLVLIGQEVVMLNTAFSNGQLLDHYYFWCISMMTYHADCLKNGLQVSTQMIQILVFKVLILMNLKK